MIEWHGLFSLETIKKQLAMSAIDVWMQQPTQRFMTDPIFASLLRWNRMDVALLEDAKHPIYSKEMSLASMDAGKLDAPSS